MANTRTKHHNTGATLETTRIDHAKIVDIRMDCNGRFHWDTVELSNGLFNMSWTGYRTIADAKRSALEQGYTHYIDCHNRVQKIRVKTTF